jgi:hypothetical protein
MPVMLDEMLPYDMSREEIAIRHAALAGVDAMRGAGASQEDCVHALIGLAMFLVSELPVRERAEHIMIAREMIDMCATELCAEAALENKRRS